MLATQFSDVVYYLTWKFNKQSLEATSAANFFGEEALLHVQ